MSRFKPHIKNKTILVGKTYKVKEPINSNYGKTKELIEQTNEQQYKRLQD